MKKTTSNLFLLPYLLWIFLFVLAPVVMIIWKSFFNIEGQFTLEITRPTSHRRTGPISK